MQQRPHCSLAANDRSNVLLLFLNPTDTACPVLLTPAQTIYAGKLLSCAHHLHSVLSAQVLPLRTHPVPARRARPPAPLVPLAPAPVRVSEGGLSVYDDGTCTIGGSSMIYGRSSFSSGGSGSSRATSACCTPTRELSRNSSMEGGAKALESSQSSASMMHVPLCCWPMDNSLNINEEDYQLPPCSPMPHFEVLAELSTL